MRFRLLGPLAITADGETVDLGGPRQRRVAACLIAASPDSLSVDQLIDEVWGDQPPATAAHVISTYVSGLRKALGERIISRDGFHRVDLSDDDVDTVQFQDLLERGRSQLGSDPVKARLLLDEAVQLRTGRPLGGLGDDSPFLRLWSERMDELHLQAIEARATAQLELREHDQVVAELQSLVEAHPYRERLWAQFMLALYRSGRQVEALRTARRLSDTLLEEMGLSPSADITELEQRILLQDPDLQAEAVPAVVEVRRFLSSFVGRNLEIASLSKALETQRLVTLIGPGGIGKTRLGYETADRLQGRYIDGIRSVDVALIDDPEAFLPELARSFGVVEQAGSSLAEILALAISGKQLLLICDNCEHLAEAVAGTLAGLLEATRRLTILVTSRVPLRIQGEALITVPPMSMPSEAETAEPDELLMADAIRLFADRAEAVRRDFRLDDESAGDVVRICRRLDALPLAIEMAVSRLDVLAPSQIAHFLEDRLANLDSLTRDTVARHQTLRDAFEWSYDLLSSSGQLLLSDLSVFVGEFKLNDIAAVAGPTISDEVLVEALRELSDASLLTIESGAGAESSYRLLQTIKEFALERLDESGRADGTYERHATHYLNRLEEAGAVVNAPPFQYWMSTIHDAYAEIQQALEGSLDRHPRSRTLRAARALREYWQRTGMASESARWAARFLEDSEGAPPAQRADAYNCDSFAHTMAGRFGEARAAGMEAARLAEEAGDNERLVTSLFTTAQAALSLGDAENMFQGAQRALDICESNEFLWQRAKPLTVLAFAEFFGTGRFKRARELFEKALPIYRELGDIGSLVLMTLGPLCTLCLRMGYVADAERYGRMAVEAGGGGWQASALACLGEVYVATGDLDRAEALQRSALSKALETGLELWFRIALRNLALIATHRAEFEPAARLHGASLRNMPQFGMDPTVYEQIESDGRAMLGDDSFERLCGEGREMAHQAILELVFGAASHG